MQLKFYYEIPQYNTSKSDLPRWNILQVCTLGYQVEEARASTLDKISDLQIDTHLNSSSRPRQSLPWQMVASLDYRVIMESNDSQILKEALAEFIPKVNAQPKPGEAPSDLFKILEQYSQQYVRL